MQGYRRSRKEFSWSRCTVDNVEFSLIKVLLFVHNTICHQLTDRCIQNKHSSSSCVAASPAYVFACHQARLYVRVKNPLLAIRMVIVLVLMLFMLPSRRSLFGVDAQVSAKRMRRRGEMTVSVRVFLVCVLASC